MITMQNTTTEFHSLADLTDTLRRLRIQGAAATHRKPDEPRTGELSRKAMVGLLQAIANEVDLTHATFMALLLYTRAEPESLLACRWGDRPYRVFLDIGDQTKMGINLPMGGLPKGAWEERFADQYVFGDPSGSAARINIDEVLARVTEAAGLDCLTFEDLKTISRYGALFETRFD